MRARNWLVAPTLAVIGLAVSGCHKPSAEPATPPPDARRPVIKSEAELAAEREARIVSGEVIETASPNIPRPGQETAPAPAPRTPLVPTAGAIQADILMVNDAVLTVPEVLYPLRTELVALRAAHTPAGFRDQAARLVRRQTQEMIGTLLVYDEAIGQLEDPQKETLDAAIDREVADVVAREFGGSEARLSAYLQEWGLTRELLRENIGRRMVVTQYTREKLLPQVRIRRDELLRYYRENQGRYATPETRELLLIALPFDQFLPEGVAWAQAAENARAQAKLKALRQAREAAEALAEREFGEVAREFSRGFHAEDGGSWGMIGRPLQPPYDQVSRLIFEFEEGQVSEPIETETGWYIVRCGKIQPAREQAFVDVQDEIRTTLMDRRFAKLSTEYVLRLADSATISALDPFITAATRRAIELTDTNGG